ncbi:metallopeptidase family M24 domain-containing protein [Hirsutella rhossiliensis]|uniref:Xaa-Pro aminopeptidase n=1 Tax=Hirsutella rhossiliensis TaxID=111463 RepID=A0A9P8SE73_9HYPO|nr:metallopeptidase family m24 domain-containing protein [Hirsutella rhossiliensis]KAH0958669.1 metallopeptidase family m24 domain-containing protein [Hirsutella rhossiliensis]
MRLPRLSFPRPSLLHTAPSRPARPLLFQIAASSLRSCRTRSYASVSAAALKFGQPVHETHPHILGPGQLTPGITAEEYANRRAHLARALPDGAVAVLPAAALQYKSGAVFHPYRQESNFFWLTGWNEDDAVAVIEKTSPERGDYLFHMFVKRKDPREEQWSGYRNGVDAAEDVFNADKALPLESAATALPRILESAKLVYADAMPGVLAANDSSSLAANKMPLSPVMNKLRVVKSTAEVANMRRAGQLSGRAITEAMRRPWTREKDLHAFLDYQFVVNGCEGPAYIPVVAGGERANCIHYTVNNDVFRDGDFILVDAGGEYGSYITDISRTWPASGRFTAAQRDLYEAVLRVQRTSVSLCRASARMSLEDIHGVTARGLVDQLQGIGFDVSMANLGQLFPHHVGHYIGLDVHDCPGYSRRELLQAGHCVTIEPGVYVPDDERWPRHFRGMGIRIEDSVCVDDESPFILSTEAVKEVDDIEALRP